MLNWIACATLSSVSFAANNSAMSIPAETPAAVTYLPSTTTLASS